MPPNKIFFCTWHVSEVGVYYYHPLHAQSQLQRSDPIEIFTRVARKVTVQVLLRWRTDQVTGGEELPNPQPGSRSGLLSMASSNPDLHRPAPQSKYWMFTYNNPSRDHLEGLPDLIGPEGCSYVVCQLEKAPTTGTLHLQGYIELPKRGRFTTVKTIFAKAGITKPVHFEGRRGSQQQAITYCTKDESREADGGPWHQGEAVPSQQGKRNDLLALRDAIKEKRPLSEIFNDDDVAPHLVKYHKAAQFMKNVYELAEVAQDEFRLIDCEVLYGPTGSGKTRKATAAGAFKWNPSTPEWWDGYEGQTTIMIDEFNGQVKITRMLQLLDGYKLRLPVKGSFCYARWTKIYITSNKHPDDWYKLRDPTSPFGDGGGVDPKHVQALMRRITKITEIS